ncbi:MAG: SID1 transmembrane family member [Gemmataceae bacterium]|nr:SID1 transmembrane family member [Gemmataceae bacterium]MCI0742205.1 SID1 transmembrane family member [Gemmataceae bacterium]
MCYYNYLCSHGYVAAGGPGLKRATDTVEAAGYRR